MTEEINRNRQRLIEEIKFSENKLLSSLRQTSIRQIIVDATMEKKLAKESAVDQIINGVKIITSKQSTLDKSLQLAPMVIELISD